MKKGLLKVAGIATAGLLALSACSNNTDEPTPEGPSELIVGITSGPTTLNSGVTSSQNTGLIASAVFDGLVRIDRNGTPQPQLATEWSVSDDGTVYTFTLRDDVVFHDGEKFNAEDVKFTFEEVAPLSPYQAALNTVFDGVDIVSEYVVDIKLTSPFAPFLNAIARERIPILPQHVYSQGPILDNPANLAPIGSGPYKFESWDNADVVVLSSNAEYWGQVAEIDSLVFRVIPDRTTLTNSLVTGEIDFIQTYWMPYEQVTALSSNPNIHMERDRVYPTYTYLSFNVDNGPLRDEGVRRALFQAIDREYINQVAFLGHAIPADSFIPAVYDWGRNPDALFDQVLPYNPDAAAAALDALGYPEGSDGTRFSLRYVYSPAQNPTTQPIGDVIKQNLEAIGVRVEFVSVDTATYLETVYTKREYDLAANRLNTGGDPSLGVARVYVENPTGRAHSNPSSYSNPEVNSLWADVNTSVTLTERGDALKRIQDILIQEFPSAPIIEEPSYDGLRDRFDGVADFFDAFEHGSVQFNYLTLKK